MDTLSGHAVSTLDDGLKRFHLEAAADKIRSFARPCFYLRLATSSDEFPIGASRMGGLPDLPRSTNWPQEDEGFLNFIAQVNFAEIPRDVPTTLPREGMVYFFVGSDETCLTVTYRLIYDAGPEGVRRREAPPAKKMANPAYLDLKPHALSIVPGVDLPSYGSEECQAACDGLGKTELGDAETRYIDLCAWLTGCADDRESYAGKLLGFTSQVYGEDRIVRNAVLTKLGRERILYQTHMSLPEFDQKLKGVLASADKDGADRWLAMRSDLAWYHSHQAEFADVAARWGLLWQIESNYRVGLCIWDAGSFNILIESSRLAQRDFGDLFVQIETS